MKIGKPKWLEKRRQAKKDEERKKLHSTPETTYNIAYRIPTLGDTTVAYDYGDILELYSNADSYAMGKIDGGMQVDDKTGKFLRQDIEVRSLMLKALLVEWRERHRNARISINEEKLAYKQQLELELEDLLAKYEELGGGKKQ